MLKASVKIGKIAIVLLLLTSLILLLFGFGEEGWRIFRVVEFWQVINSLWLAAILLILLVRS